jgi:integrase
MTKHNAENERIKRKYFAFLKEAKRQSELTVDAAAKALSRFEEYTRHRNFKAFHFEQAVAFKRHLAEQTGQRSGEKLSKATLHATLTQLKSFFFWLAGQPGYKARLQYSDAEYFKLSDKDTRIATAQRERKAPTLEQVKHVIQRMPAGSETECRNRALVAFTLLTGARDSAIASMKLKHVDLKEGCIQQDAREVKTKFSKTFTTYFFLWVVEFRRLWRNGCDFCGKRSCGAMMIRCSRRRGSRWERHASLKQRAWNGSTGAAPGLSGRSSVRRLNLRACPISIRTA